MLEYLLSDEWKSLVKALQKVPQPYRQLTAGFLFPKSIIMVYDRIKLSHHFDFEFSEKDFEDFWVYFSQQNEAQSLEGIYQRWLEWRDDSSDQSINSGCDE